MITVNIPEHNARVNFPDDTPESEMQSVLEQNFAPRKGVLGKSADVLASIPERAYKGLRSVIPDIQSPELPPPGLYDLSSPLDVTEDSSTSTIKTEDVISSLRPPEKPEKKEFISSRAEEPPGLLERIFKKPQEFSPKDRAKAANIVALAEQSGLPTSHIEKNYDLITKQIGIRGTPTSEELIAELSKWAILTGLGVKTLKTIIGVAVYMGTKEAESVGTQAVKGEEIKLGAGREVKELFGELKEPWKSAVDVAELVYPGVFSVKAPKQFKQWYYNLTVKERRLVRLTPEQTKVVYDDLRKSGLSEAELAREYNQFRQEAIGRRATGEPVPESKIKEPIAPVGPVGGSEIEVTEPKVDLTPGLFGKVVSRIKEPNQRAEFVKDVRIEAKETGKTLDEVVKEKVGKTDPEVDIPAPAGESVKAKKPWEMTQSEAISHKEKIDERHSQLVREEMYDIETFGKDSPEAKESAQATKDFELENATWVGGGGAKKAKTIHRARVQSAIEQGHPVPPEVMREYPELVPTVTPAEGEKVAPTPFGEALKPKEPWEMTKEEWVREQGKRVSGQSVKKTTELAKNLHRQYVKIWLSEGKPVSPEVLKEYPELAPKPPEPGKVKPKKQKKPGTFVKWVIDEGGIWDKDLTGETRQFQGREAGIIGLVSKKGKSFDKLTERAIEDNWIEKDASVRDFINLLEQDANAAKHGKPRVQNLSEDQKVKEHPEFKLTPEEKTAEDKGFDLTGGSVRVGDLKKGDKILIKGEEFEHKGFDSEDNAIFKDGETITEDPFGEIEAEGVKIAPVDRQAEILEKIKKENPEEYAKILKGNTAELVKEWEVKREGKSRGMRQGEMFGEDKPQGGMFAEAGEYAKREPGYDYSIGNDKPAIIEMPELVELYGNLASGKIPRLAERLRAAAGKALGQFNPATGEVTLRKDLFADIATAAKVLSHEIGHLVDWLPDHYLKRGNILGHIGSLRKYIKTLLEEYPSDTRKTYGILTDFDRAKLRKEAERQLASPKGEDPRAVSADDILQVWNAVEKANPKLKEYIARLSREEKVSIAKAAIKGNVPDWVTFRYEDIPTQDIRDIYRKLVEREIENRRLYEKEKIMAELKDLTQKWKPFNIAENPSYTKYRHSSVELYADAISVLFNEPKLLKDTAPTFHKAFFAYLERKPEVMKHYEEIQARISRGPEEIAAAREARMDVGMKVAEENWKKTYEPAAWEDKTITKIKKALSDRFASIWDFTKDPKTRQEVENLIYEGAEQQFYLNETASKVLKPLEDAKIDQRDLEKLYTLNAILKGSRTIKVDGIEARVSIANPYGISKETAPSILQRIAERYGHAGFNKLQEAQKAHWEIRQFVIDRLKQANVYPKELMERIEDNEFYAHFLINEYITSKYGSGVSGSVFRQVGTLKENAPAFTATVMKDLSQLMVAQRKLATKAVVDDMHANYPEFIKPAKTKWNGKAHVPIESTVRGEGLLSYAEEGKMKGFYVPEGIAEAFQKNPVESWMVSKWLNNLSHPFRQLFIAWNPGFWAFNLKRDFNSAILTLPEATIKEYAPLWFKSFVPAMRDAFKGLDPTVQKMLEEKMLIPSFDYQGMLTEDIALERMLIKFSIKDPTLKNPVLNQFDKFFRTLDKLAAATERVPKIAAYRYLRAHFPEMPIAEVAERVRRAGSPPFLIKGQATPLLNNIFLFSNAFIRGTEMHGRAIKENPAEYAWKQTKYTLLPKILMYAASIGLLGEEIRKVYELSSDYDKTNYFVIPLGTTKEGRGVTLRVPFDEQSRLLGGVFWKLLTGIKSPQDAAKLFDYTAGQFPGVNPAFSMVFDLMSYLGGRNPYDSFRGRYAIPEVVFKAQDRRSVEAFGKYLAQKGGLGILYKFENDDLERVKGELEKVLGYPIVSNVIGRFIKVTDIGITEKIRKETDPIERDLARINLDVKSALTKAVNNKDKEITKGEIESVLYKIRMDREDAMIKQLMALLAKKHGGEGQRYLESYMRAQSVEVKAKILEMMLNEAKKK